MSPGLPMFIAWNQMTASAALLGVALASLAWAWANEAARRAVAERRPVHAARLPPSAASRRSESGAMRGGLCADPVGPQAIRRAR